MAETAESTATTSEETSIDPAAAAETEEPKTEAPPWGEDFDPERAWKTIQNLREIEREHKKMLADRDREAEERAEAEKSELQKAQEAAEKARSEALEARRELWTTRALKGAGLPEDLSRFLTGTTEEEIGEQAEALAAHLKKEDKEEPAPKVPSKPRPALKPGEGGSEGKPAFDPEALAKKVAASPTYC
jgi:hypothetical protein